MKTFINTKTGRRLPQHGCWNWFNPAWNDKARAAGKWDYHIKPGPDCTKGWKPCNLKIWKQEEIPDLKEPFTDDQFKEYAGKYGLDCAQEFLGCCDLMKPHFARRILTPLKNIPSPEAKAFFQEAFGRSCMTFAVPMIDMILDTYSFDILAFEKFLVSHFRYPAHKNGSMLDFIKRKFGLDAESKFRKYFLEK